MTQSRVLIVTYPLLHPDKYFISADIPRYEQINILQRFLSRPRIEPIFPHNYARLYQISLIWNGHSGVWSVTHNCGSSEIRDEILTEILLDCRSKCDPH